MLLVAFSKYTGRAVFDDGSLELLPLGEEERLGRRKRWRVKGGRGLKREEEEGARRRRRRIRSSGKAGHDLIALEFSLTKAT